MKTLDGSSRARTEETQIVISAQDHAALREWVRKVKLVPARPHSEIPIDALVTAYERNHKRAGR